LAKFSSLVDILGVICCFGMVSDLFKVEVDE
jgi:hypothetical protein